jgi:tRNA threonylcarbamoyladenosine biosynthesis protein TsaE
MASLETTSASAEATKAIGEVLGALVKPGDYLCLTGELGAGKTVFVQGLAKGMGVTGQYVTSPSYALVNEYRGRLTLYHIDLYRLSGTDDLIEIGFSEYPGTGVAAVEWPERAAGLLPDDRLDVRIEYAGENTRRLLFEARGDRHKALLEGLCQSTRWSRP